MKRFTLIFFIVLLSACGEDAANDAGHDELLDAGIDDDATFDMDATTARDAETMPSNDMHVPDAGDDDGADAGMDSGAEDAGITNDAGTEMSDSGTMSDADMDSLAADAGVDMEEVDMGASDAGVSDDAGTTTDSGSSGVYDTTGWTMERATRSDSASSGTPDSYFFDVASGSPLSASISGGGGGTWSVNVFGGMTNVLYCTGSTSCQVMLDPQDTTVIITAVTTDIGYYTLTIDYASGGRQ